MAETTITVIPREAYDDFHMTMGRCVAQWAHVDDYLFLICHGTLQAPKEKAAIVYYRTGTLEGRMSLTDELVKMALPQHKPGDHPHDDAREWSAIYKVMDKLKQIRNRIAHCHTGIHLRALSAPAEDIHADSWFSLYESHYQKLRGRPVPEPLQIPDLRSHRAAVENLRNQLHHFYYETLPKHVKLPPPR